MTTAPHAAREAAMISSKTFSRHIHPCDIA
jgi:hypothetical protein